MKSINDKIIEHIEKNYPNDEFLNSIIDYMEYLKDINSDENYKFGFKYITKTHTGNSSIIGGYSSKSNTEKYNYFIGNTTTNQWEKNKSDSIISGYSTGY